MPMIGQPKVSTISVLEDTNRSRAVDCDLSIRVAWFHVISYVSE